MFPRAIARIIASVPSGLKYRLARFKPIYTRLLRAGSGKVTIDTAAGPICWNIDALTSQAHVLGSYEPYMQQAFMRHVMPGSVVYDIGAHAGFHALFCGLLTGARGRVLAFEPNPANQRSIERQLAANAQLPVTLVPVALSSASGTLRMDFSPSSSQGYVSAHGGAEVEASTIDDLVASGRCPAPDVVKIDVEGHEKAVLQGALHTIRNSRPVILCDYNDDTTLSMVQTLLSPYAYSVEQGPPVVAIPQRAGEAGSPR